MASLIDRDREPTPGELRWFGALLLAFASALGALVYLGSGRIGPPIAVAAVGGTLCGVYYAVPALRRAMLRAWVTVTHPLGWLASHAALGIFYYLLLTPIGLLMRLAGRDALHRRLERDQPSYWIVRQGRTSTNRYWHQY